MEEKFSEKFKKFFSSEESLKRVPIYLFFICVLLVVLIFRLGEINHNLKEIADNGTEVIELHTKENAYDDVAEFYIETTKTAEDYIPMLEIMTDENEESTEFSMESSEEASTDKSEASSSQSNDNSTNKTTYVLNISSKKIHHVSCSFAERTKDENKKVVRLSAEELQEYLNDGYTLCKTCGGK